MTGLWEPVLTPAEWETITGLLAAGGIRPPGHNARKFLLTGTMRCGKNGCGKRMRAVKATRAKGRPGQFFYACPSVAEGGCGGTSINGGVTDRLITELILAKYETEADRHGDGPADEDVWPGQVSLDRLREDMTALTAQWRTRRPDGTRVVPDSRYFPQYAALEDEERALIAERRRHTAGRSGRRPRPVRAQWPDYTLPQQRAYIEQALTAVTVHPAARPGIQTEETVAARLDPVWAEDR